MPMLFSAMLLLAVFGLAFLADLAPRDAFRFDKPRERKPRYRNGRRE